MKNIFVFMGALFFIFNFGNAQTTLINSGILTQFNICYSGGGGCDANCQSFVDAGSPYNQYIINTTGTATVNAASGAGILCNNTTQAGNCSATTATATYTLDPTCTYTVIAAFGKFWTGNCPDCRMDGGDEIHLSSGGGATVVSQGATLVTTSACGTPGPAGTYTYATADIATGCSNAIGTATLIVTGGTTPVVNISYTSNRADEILTFDIYASTPTCGFVILPVQLIGFNAFLSNNITAIWQTASETNSNYFAVELSEDGINFQDYAEVKAAGNSTQLKKYSTAINYSKNIPSIIYIRLKLVDKNGKYTYSNVIKYSNAEVPIVNTYYNYNRDKIITQFHLDYPQEISVSLFDLAGNIISSTNTQLFNTGDNEILLTAPDNAGVYFFNYNSGDKIPIHKKIIVSK